MKNFVQRWLASLARQIIAKHKPKIIGITGSVGKTSTRDAIYAVVSTAFSVRKGSKNFNNEFGLPFAVLGADAPGRNPFNWLWIFIKGYFTLWLGGYPQVLVLEMGVDKPGDMDYLLSIAKPDIAVLTSIGISHYEFFQSREAVALEKGKLIAALSSEGTAILRADDDLIMAQAERTQAKVIRYGFYDNNDVVVSAIDEHLEIPVYSKITIHTALNDFEVKVNGVGRGYHMATAAAVAVGLNLNISVANIQTGLQHLKPIVGRLNFLPGIKKTILIDDSYNASPDSMRAALQILVRMPQRSKYAVLGDMLELGELTEQSHKEIGEEFAKIGVDPKMFGVVPVSFHLITVGKYAGIMAQAAIQHGMSPENIIQFPTSLSAVEYLQKNITPESVVLIKGSQGVRMERITKELLLDPMSATNVLPRQYGGWLNG